jgi:hypothetical protein
MSEELLLMFRLRKCSLPKQIWKMKWTTVDVLPIFDDYFLQFNKNRYLYRIYLNDQIHRIHGTIIAKPAGVRGNCEGLVV